MMTLTEDSFEKVFLRNCISRDDFDNVYPNHERMYDHIAKTIESLTKILASTK